MFKFIKNLLTKTHPKEFSIEERNYNKEDITLINNEKVTHEMYHAQDQNYIHIYRLTIETTFNPPTKCEITIPGFKGRAQLVSNTLYNPYQDAPTQLLVFKKEKK